MGKSHGEGAVAEGVEKLLSRQLKRQVWSWEQVRAGEAGAQPGRWAAEAEHVSETVSRGLLTQEDCRQPFPSGFAPANVCG